MSRSDITSRPQRLDVLPVLKKRQHAQVLVVSMYPADQYAMLA